MKTKSVVIIIAMLGILLLTGCGVKMSTTTTIEPSGSGTNSFIVALDTQQVQSPMVWTTLSIARQDLEREGGQVEDWAEGHYEGFIATFEFQDLDEMASQLTEPYLSEDITLDSTFRNAFFEEVEAWFDEDGMAHFVARGQRGEDISMGSEYSFTLVMPGRIESFSHQEAAQQIDDNTVTWDMTRLGTGEFELVAVSKVNRFPWVWIGVGAMCCGSIILFTVVVGLVVLLRRKSA